MDVRPDAEFAIHTVELVDRPWFPYICTEVEGWRWHAEIENHYNFWLSLQGSGSITCDGQYYNLQPGMCFIFKPGQKVDARHLSGECITRFSAHFVPLTIGHHGKAEVCTMDSVASQLGDIKAVRKKIDKIICELINPEPDEQLLTRRVYDLIKMVALSENTITGDESPGVAKAVEYIQRSFCKAIVMDELARDCGMSRSHFDREFSRIVGMPPKRYHLKCRLAEAMRLLKGSTLTVTEISNLLGYQDVYFFSRQFKQNFGVPPSEYRHLIQ